jgi:MYXO-CTERM domain-containing protein
VISRGPAFFVAILLAAFPDVAGATPPLHTPWPCDVSYPITQGHNGGSHTDNGAWAWDIGIPVGGEVSAPADGVVRLVKMDSTVGGCSSAYGNDANYVIVDFGDGTEALFLHLEPNSSPFVPGDVVSQGDVVGRVGLTGWVCGAHLHFQIQETCASWWCPSIPSTFVDYGDPQVGADLVSNNCPPQEPCTAVADGGELVIDELSACFERETSYWWNVAEGYEAHHYYTLATDAEAPETIGRWRFDVSVGGTYRFDVFVPDTEASSDAAAYGVDGGTGVLPFGPIDQSTRKGWVTVGDVELEPGTGRRVELGDNTGEGVNLDRKIAYDAVRLTYVPEPSGAGGGATTSMASTAAAGMGEGAGSNGEGGAGGDDAGADETGDGCSCATAGRRTGAAGFGLAAIMLLGLVRNLRRRAPRTN